MIARDRRRAGGDFDATHARHDDVAHDDFDFSIGIVGQLQRLESAGRRHDGVANALERLLDEREQRLVRRRFAARLGGLSNGPEARP